MSKSAFLLALGLVPTLGWGWTIAQRNEKPSCAIVVPASGGAVLKFAAEELRDHVFGMTGVTLPIRSDGSEVSGRRIVLKSDNFADDGFALRVSGDELLVQGGIRAGVLYGVYEILERYGGCGWYAMDSVRIPKTSLFEVPDSLNDRQKPAFVMRDSTWWPTSALSSNSLQAARCRMNGARSAGNDPRFGGANPFRFDTVLHNCHTFNALVPPAKYAKTHPEYYSEVHGKRLLDCTQLCLTNPDVLEIVVSNVLKRIAANPECRLFGVSQNDWGNNCTCPKCKEIDDREGSPAGTIISFVNAVAERVEKEHPEVLVETLAYQYGRKPPKTIRPRRNVMVCLCSIECEFSKPMAANRFRHNVAFREDIVRWRDIATYLYLWDYTVNFHNYVHLFPNFETLGENLRFYRDCGVTHMFEQGCGQCPHASFAELKTWLIGKFEWNPDRPIAPLLDEFFAGYYGPAAPKVREIYERVMRVNRMRDEAEYPLVIGERVNGDPRLYSAAFYEEIGRLWDEAYALVKDDAAFRDGVRWGRFGNDYTRISLARNDPTVAPFCVTAHPKDCPPASSARRAEISGIFDGRFVRMCAETPRVRLCEGDLEDTDKRLVRLGRKWRDPSVVRTVSTRLEMEEDFGYISSYPKPRGGIVADARAGNGKAMKIIGGNGWSYYVDFADEAIAMDVGRKYRVRMRARVEKVPGEKGVGLWASVYDYSRRRALMSPEFTADVEKMGDDYAWFDVGEFPFAHGATFWVAPGKRNDRNVFPVTNVYVDKIELIGCAACSSLRTD